MESLGWFRNAPLGEARGAASWESAPTYHNATARGSSSLHPGASPYPQAELNYGASSSSASGSHAGGVGFAHYDRRGNFPAMEPMEMRQAPGWNQARNSQVVSVHSIQTIVKNTFVDVVDVNETSPRELKRSASDSDLSKSSEEKLHWWLPSLTSSSKDYSGHSGEEADDRVEAESHAGSSAIATAPMLTSQPCPPQMLPASGPIEHYAPSAWNGHSNHRLPEAPVESPQPMCGNELVNLDRDRSDAQNLPYSTNPLDGEYPAIVHQLQVETGLPLAELMELHIEHNLSLVPRHHTTGAISSVGSILHAEGGCSPCMFQPTKSCLRGITCLFCHFRHRDYKGRRIRPPKKIRDKRKESVNQTEASPDALNSSDEEECAPGASSSQGAAIGNQQSQAQRRSQAAQQRSGRMMNSQPSTKVHL